MHFGRDFSGKCRCGKDFRNTIRRQRWPGGRRSLPCFSRFSLRHFWTPHILVVCLVRGGAVWQLVGLITRLYTQTPRVAAAAF